MEQENVRELVDCIHQEFENSGLHQLLIRLTSDGQQQAHPSYRLFLREISKNTPVSGHFQAGQEIDEVLAGLKRLASNQFDMADAKQLCTIKKMQVWFPGFLQCLLPIRQLHGHLPEDVRNTIHMLAEKFQRLIDISQEDELQRREQDAYEVIGADDTLSALQFFPAWQIVRGRGKYAQDRGSRDESDTCTKYRHGHRILGPGIMLYLCPHGISYGFSVMESYESPRMPFEVFSTRYVPANIIYDNACKLHVYCLKREPALFSHCRFFVDRFHWNNHSACSIGYDMQRYSSDPTLVSVNSQVTEQLNSCLQKLRRSLSYMSYKKFMLHLKMFLYLRNIRLLCDM
jgi:hypothetical protein